MRPRPPQLDDADWLTAALTEATVADVAAQLDCPAAWVRAAKKAHGITATSRHAARPPQLDDADWLRAQLEAGRARNDIAAGLGVSASALRSALRAHGLTPAGRRGPTSHPRLADGVWLREQYERQFRNLAEIAEQLGCSSQTVGAWLRRHGIDVRPCKTTYPQLYYRWFLEPYVDDGMTREQVADLIAADVGCSRSAAELALRKHGLAERGPAHPNLEDPDWLAEAYQRHSAETIASHLGVGATTVRRAIARHGIAAPTTRRRKRRKAVYPALDRSHYLQVRYVQDRWSAKQIADEVGCSEPTVLKALRRHGIDVREPSRRAS